MLEGQSQEQREAIVKPKYKDIRQQKEVIFFVYGTLKQGFYNHRNRLDRDTVEFLGDYTTEPEYTMVSCGAFPAILKDGTTAIIGELYKTSDPAVIASVCALEGFNGLINHPGNTFYDVTVLNTPFGEAYMFYFKDKRSRYPIIESGYWQYPK